MLQVIEDKAAKAIALIIEKGSSVIDPETEIVLNEFMWSLHVRSIIWGDYPDRKDIATERWDLPFAKEDMRNIWDIWILENPGMMSPLPKERITGYELFLILNGTRHDFCTSDSPVYRLIIDEHITLSTFSPSGSGTGLMLSISPRMVLISVPPERARAPPWSGLARISEVRDEEMVVLLDLMTCFNSEEFAFARRREDLELCRSIIGATPGKLPNEGLFLQKVEALAKLR